MDAIDGTIRAALREQADAMERLCEQSLTDPLGRGILVHTYSDLTAYTMHTEYTLSSTVPWATIHEHHADPANCEACRQHA